MSNWKDAFPKENRYFETENGILCNNDALEILKQMPDNCIDTVITDPPYGLSKHSERTIREVLGKWLSGEEDYVPQKKGFMGKAWDAFVPPPALWKEVYRVMKPGGTILVFAGARTQDLMAMSLRLAGFEIKDTLMWLYGSGFPKATDISKQIDKKLGAKRKVIGKLPHPATPKKGTFNCSFDRSKAIITEPATPEAKKWEGWKSQSLKPAYEPIIMAIKPNEGSYAENALKWNVAGLNIDGARIPLLIGEDTKRKKGGYQTVYVGGKLEKNYDIKFQFDRDKGRFPANILLDEEAAKMLDEQSGISVSKGGEGKRYGDSKSFGSVKGIYHHFNDKGGASRFFYVAKASAKERNMGLSEDLRNIHPTVKPLKLIEYLVKLTSMPNENQIYLDPFIGSGTTAMACEKLQRKWLGIELNSEYCEIAKRRILSAIRII